MIGLNVLTLAEVEAIHQATMRVLAEVGIILTEAEAREILVGPSQTHVYIDNRPLRGNLRRRSAPGRWGIADLGGGRGAHEPNHHGFAGFFCCLTVQSADH